MKVSFLMAIARQVDGEYVFVDVLKSHSNPDKLYRFLRENELPQTNKFGEVECVIEYGVIENVEVEIDGEGLDDLLGNTEIKAKLASKLQS